MTHYNPPLFKLSISVGQNKILTFNNNKMRILTTTKLALALSVLIFSSCEQENVNPSANVTKQDRTIVGYSGIEISSAITVDVTFSATEDKIEIEANENLHALIDVEESRNNLVIKIKDHTNIRGRSTIKAHITTTSTLDEILVSGASFLRFNNQLEATDLYVGISGASFFIGDIIANSMKVYLDGASNLEVAGSVESFDLDASGASEMGSYDMIVSNAKMKMTGASQASITINNVIDLNASDASVLRYKGAGSPNNLKLSGAAQIIRVD